jgi:hypothetical protein
MVQRRDFTLEGVVEVGPHVDHFVLFNGEMLGKMLSRYAGLELASGEYTRLGRARITVEWLAEDVEWTEEASPT